MKEMKNIAGRRAEGIPTGEDGSRKTEVGSRKTEDGSWKSEDGIPKLVFASGVATKPVGSRLSPFVKGDERSRWLSGLVAGSEGVRFWVSRFCSFPGYSNSMFVPMSPFVKGDERSRWLSGLVAGSEGVKNPSPATTKENNEHRISLPRCLEGNNESGWVHTRNLTDNDIQTDIQKSAPSPPLWVYSHGRGREGLTPHLPRGGFYSGDCPGAAAITITYSLFSSPWVSPIFAGTNRLERKNNLPVTNQQALHRSSFVPLNEGDESRFIGTGGKEDESRFTGTGGKKDKPRFSESGGKNHKTLQQGTFVPLEKGDEISRWLSGLVAGSEGVQEVSKTTPKIRMKGFLKERRYAVT